MTTLDVSAADVRLAAERIASGIVRTPSVRSRTLSDAAGADVILKIETRQTTGSYKERGALNAMLALAPEQRARGIVTMSAGNHGQAVAYHGARLGLRTTVVMPETTPLLKVRRTRDFGAEVVLAGATFADAAAHARELAATAGATLVHPYDDPQVIAGQATATLELLEDAGDLDVILVPVGGGGLIAGAALAIAAYGSRAELFGVQSALYPSVGAALDERPVAGGPTIAEGIAVTRVGTLNESLIREHVRGTLLVSEAAIETAIATLLEDEKLVVEGAGAAGVAALQSDPERFAGKRVGTLLCGGNIDLGMLAAVIVRHRMRSGRVVRIRVHMVDKPGELASVATALADARANVLDVAHHRVFGSLSAKHAELDLTVEIERSDDLPAILARLAEIGFDAELVRE
ncbi:threonine ammonia-lyase [Vulcanimicrobium alpinum]|uniref:threonine ammonia-lyase n=1 Tax=Vulcanimicrobium alpinum TaxID=3016050 RepID=A0AAN1XVW4_UNVUL|nr:threonine ammonia-lyase [Vulcanimicrobium alpinum]BDE05242.1 threonine ammonia-lyase [Vulcanimicrobium alpinum]